MVSSTELIPTLTGAYHVVAGGGQGTRWGCSKRGAQASPLPTSRCPAGSLRWPPWPPGAPTPLSPLLFLEFQGHQCRLIFGVRCQSPQCQQHTRGVCLAADKAPCQRLLCHTECQPRAAASPCPPFSATPLPAPSLRQRDSQVGASFAIF